MWHANGDARQVVHIAITPGKKAITGTGSIDGRTGIPGKLVSAVISAAPDRVQLRISSPAEPQQFGYRHGGPIQAQLFLVPELKSQLYPELLRKHRASSFLACISNISLLRYCGFMKRRNTGFEILEPLPTDSPGNHRIHI